MGKTSPYRESLLNALTDPEEAAAYLNAGLEDSVPAFLKALENVTQARQMVKTPKDSGVQRDRVDRSLSEQGKPTLEALTTVLGALGLRMRVEAEAPDSAVVSGEGEASSRGKRREVEHAVA